MEPRCELTMQVNDIVSWFGSFNYTSEHTRENFTNSISTTMLTELKVLRLYRNTVIWCLQECIILNHQIYSMLSFMQWGGTTKLTDMVYESTSLVSKGKKVMEVNKRWGFRRNLIWCRIFRGGGFCVMRMWLSFRKSGILVYMKTNYLHWRILRW